MAGLDGQAVSYVPFRTANDVVNNFLAEATAGIPAAYERAYAEKDPAVRAEKIEQIDRAAAFVIAFEWLLLQSDGEDLVARAEALLREAQ